MTKPNFIIIGAMKAATSSVSRFLEHHDQVFMPHRTEPRFFNRDDHWTKGPEWYASLFDGAAPGQLIGEGTNNYTFGKLYPHTVDRMAEFAPDAKLIYMVRHPITRIVSAWIQNRVDQPGETPADINEAIASLPDRLIDPSMYSSQLERYRQRYADEQIFVGFMEDMKRDPDQFFASVCDFLEISRPTDGAATQGIHANPSKGKAVPTGGFEKLRAIPGMRLAAKLAPKGMRRMVKKATSKTLEERPVFTNDLHEQLIGKLRPDAEQLLSYAGKPNDYWDWTTY